MRLKGPVLAVTPSLVIAATVASDGSSTRIDVLSRVDGDPALESVALHGQMSVGAVAGDRLYVTGYAADLYGDPGVFAISLLDGTVTSVIESREVPERSAPIARSMLVSRSGNTLISSVCTIGGGCSGGSVIDAASGRLVAELATGDGPSALNDAYALVRSGGDVTTSLALFDWRNNRELWRLTGDEFGWAYVTDAGVVVAGVGDRLGKISLDGRVDYSAELPGRSPTLWPALSTDALVVVGTNGPFPGNPREDGVLGEHGVVQATVVDLRDLSVEADAITIDLNTQS